MSNPKGTPANLRPRPPWPKGFCPNPGGRPKSAALSEALREEIELAGIPENKLPEKLKKVTGPRALARKIVREAMKGKRAHFQEIADRVEGKAVARIELAPAAIDLTEGKDFWELRFYSFHARYPTAEEKEQFQRDNPNLEKETLAALMKSRHR